MAVTVVTLFLLGLGSGFLIEACQAGAARLRTIGPALRERMTGALTAAGAPVD